ncbi:sphingomyelin phosphodiesterase-like isoform X2 [Varroa jacobsoni]|uniref:sphingomyelin phosphodiesterase-like isoform X2 n=1 Tax=Varroa jacobsoni TaxID=62625 RepID=UPI000BF6BBB8|nr:sphingomyelin phosphodiesterase-like isoform X2 [Varroa jacobsoni]
MIEQKRFVDYMIHGNDTEGFCEQCEPVLEMLKNDPKGTLESAVDACKETRYYTPRICDEEYRMYSGVIIKIAQQLEPPLKDVCKFLSGGACGTPESERFNWRISLQAVEDDAQLSDKHFHHHESEWGQTHLSMLHVTDTHFDEDYDVGADALCNEPICCTKYQNQTTDINRFAPPWGHPGGGTCDIPIRTVENMFQDIDRSRHVTFAIWTGDISAHVYLGMTKERAVKNIQETTAIIKRYLRKVRVFPAIGNHDAFPDRLFPQPGVDAGEFSVKPVYEEMWNLWYDWLPADQENVFKYGGYYTAKVRPQLRIISLNTNFCYTSNWWLVLGANDPARQLQWLIATLDEARYNRERVFIIGHIPPGSSTCNQYWEDAYFDIVTKFRRTITGQFFAHMHTDEVILDYHDAQDSTKATSVLYVTPAVTTSWSGMPEYRIFQTEMGEVVDVETYFLNLTTANAGYFKIRESVHDKVRNDFASMSPFRRRAMEKVLYGDPHWELGYSARKSYGLRKFDAESWAKLIQQFDKDDNLLQAFYKHHLQFRESVVRQERPCDAACKNKLVRYMTSQRTLRQRLKAAQENPEAKEGDLSLDSEER